MSFWDLLLCLTLFCVLSDSSCLFFVDFFWLSSSSATRFCSAMVRLIFSLVVTEGVVFGVFALGLDTLEVFLQGQIFKKTEMVYKDVLQYVIKHDLFRPVVGGLKSFSLCLSRYL
jgi:hypothetical protein